MKTTLSFFILIIFSALLVILSSCQKTQNSIQTWYLTGVDSSIVVKEVLAATDEFADAASNMDADREIQLWDSSTQMMFAENGRQFENRDSIYSAINNWYVELLDEVVFKWEERNILPISPRVAHLFGRFYFRGKFKSGEIFEARPYDTWLLVKQDDTWKIIRGHESYNTDGND